jgi:nitroreductase
MKQELNFFEAVQQRRSVRVFDQMGTFDGTIVQKCLEAAILSPNSSNLQLYQFVRVPEYSPLKDRLAQLCMGQKAATTARELVVVLTRRDRWKAHAKANSEFITASSSGEGDKKVKLARRYYRKLVPMLYWKFPGWSFIKKLIAITQGLRNPMVREVSETAVRISVHKSASLACMTFMLGMKAAGYDTCPMEGFVADGLQGALGIPATHAPVCLLAVGRTHEDAAVTAGTGGPQWRFPLEEVVKGL